MIVWRIVTARIATLTEIDTSWCLDDILDANAVLDYQAAAQAEAQRRAKK